MCNGCEDLEPTLSELNECSCREIICCDGESACKNRTSTVGQVLNEKLLRVILVDISNYFSVYFDLITGRISPTLHLQLNNRRDRFSVLRRRSEVVNSRSWMHNWRKMWSCVAEVELVSCEPLRMVLLVIFWKQTKDKEIWRWIFQGWHFGIDEVCKTQCIKTWNRCCFLCVVFSKPDFTNQRCYSSKLCA